MRLSVGLTLGLFVSAALAVPASAGPFYDDPPVGDCTTLEIPPGPLGVRATSATVAAGAADVYRVPVESNRIAFSLAGAGDLRPWAVNGCDASGWCAWDGTVRAVTISDGGCWGSSFADEILLIVENRSDSAVTYVLRVGDCGETLPHLSCVLFP